MNIESAELGIHEIELFEERIKAAFEKVPLHYFTTEANKKKTIEWLDDVFGDAFGEYLSECKQVANII
jgi:protein-L-isoaspartate O-methyltransferase